MQLLNLTLPTPAENVALDEALLDWAEEEAANREVLRIWESPQPIVVAGRSSRIGQEIDAAECKRRHIPIVRRSSGGAAIVAGWGCLMYALVLCYKTRPKLRDISHAHAFVLARIAESLRPLVAESGEVARAGTSDLVLIEQAGAHIARKFSGNSLRIKRTHCLYHGTLLYDFDLPLLASCLRIPPRQPDYRGARRHLDFVTNLPLNQQRLVDAIDEAWPTAGMMRDVPLSRVANLVADRFGRESWNLEFA